MAVDFEGYEKAYRLRSSADDELLVQVFGKEEAAGLAEANPTLLETARMYFPHLTSSTYDRLSREPETLKQEKARCEREMESLAIQNYGAFISSANVTQVVRGELADIQKHLDGVVDTIGPMHEAIQEFQAASARLGSQRTALRNVLQQHSGLLELLELPQLLDACIRNQMYDESLELLAYCSNMLRGHEARGEEIAVLGTLRDQVAVQRSNLHSSLVAQLKTDIHLPACVRVIGFLRRIQRHTEDELCALFIEHRGGFLEGHKQQVEVLRGNRGSVVNAMRNAADLLRTHVYDIGTQYKALFPQDDGPLATWLSEQIAWFTNLLRCHLLPASGEASTLGGGGKSQAGAAMAGAARGPAFGGTRIDAASITMVLKQCLIASSTLKRLGGHFFPAVAGIFDARMQHHVSEMLDIAVLTFQAELGRYDWVPSTAIASSAASASAMAAAGAAGGAAGTTGWLHPQALELTRHRPLAVFTNDLVQVFNELRQCTLYALRVHVVNACFECLSGAVSLLRSAKSSQAALLGSSTSPKAAEFTRLCRHLAHILAPLVAAHVEALFGASARLDVASLVASMVPDLLPAAEAEYPAVDLDTEGAGEAPAEVPAQAADPAAAESIAVDTKGHESVPAVPAEATTMAPGPAAEQDTAASGYPTVGGTVAAPQAAAPQVAAPQADVHQATPAAVAEQPEGTAPANGGEA